MNVSKRILTVLAVLILVSMACQAMRGASPATQPPTNASPAETSPAQPSPEITEPLPSEVPPVDIPADVYPPGFASYNYSPPSLPERSAVDYSLPVDLNAVTGLDLVELSDQQQNLLGQNGFVVASPQPGKYREFYQVYESQRYAIDQPLFVTTDAIFHVYHLIFDKMLRDLERDSFIPALEKLTSTMLAASAAQYQEVIGTSLEEPARRNLAFFAVAARLLELPEQTPAAVNDLVEAELALINAHSQPSISPIWDRPDLPDDQKLIEDYSQYVPRGHYTRSEALKRYFKTMMWYGRLTYRLRDDFETRRALLLVQALRTATASDGTPAVNLWQEIYEPTAFIVGKADDLSYFEYGKLADTVFGAGAPPSALADDSAFSQFKQAAKNLPPPQINSMWVWIWEDKKDATQGFRFMGQRFTLDAYVFDQLIWRKVGTIDKPRGLPKGLDFFAALGSQEAYAILDQMGETQYEKYPQQMDKVRGEIANLEQDSWTQNLYWSWLYTFQPIIEPKDERFPAFMRTQAWTRKDLHTALASWTELKHDTILYAKQVMAEMGGGEPPKPPHGYVEPNPEAFARLLALAQMTYDGLESRNLLSDQTRANLENLIDLIQFLEKSAESELAGQPLSDDDYYRIQYIGGELEALTLAASDCDEADLSMCRNLEDQRAALVADVATGLGPDGALAALEEGEGQPAEIYVVLPDQPYRVGVGAVYTYYEFTVPPDQRMTDEQWQAQVENGTNPPAPDWTQIFIAP